LSERVAALVAAMSTAEKLAQLQGVWLGAGDDGGVVAPDMDQADRPAGFEDFARDGLGQLTRPFGTKPLRPAEGLAAVIGYQRWLKDHTRHGIGALVHEECLTGLAAWTATTFPTPLAWAATFDPAAVGAMGAAIGETMAALGIHQGLAPVLDVVRDARWGRVEETMGEDPYLIATLGLAYVQGVQSHGVLATLKHFVGYSNSRAGRNLAPVHAGPREVEEVLLFPFEVAVCDGRVGSVMPSYSEIDGVPVHSDPHYLAEILRGRWGFTGTVVSDYFAVGFLQRNHLMAADLAEAGRLALLAGVDVELPTGDAYRILPPALESDPAGRAALDRAVTTVLVQKEALGLLDLDAEIARLEALLAVVPESLDPPAHRAVAARLAEESVVLLGNEGALPLAPRAGLKLAVTGPNADRSEALFGCYAFVNHVLSHNPGVPSEIEAPTILSALRAEFPDAAVAFAPGCPVREPDRSGFAAAVAAAQAADVVIAVVGDQSGLFGAGTSGEGCDTDSLDLPGVQDEFLDALFATGTPVVLVAVTGRPYALGRHTARAAATVQAFFPGEAGAQAVAGVLSGRVNPSGRLPVSVPRTLGVLPYSYLHPKLGDPSGVSSIDTTPQFSFGHGLSYTSFEFGPLAVAAAAVPTAGWIEASAEVRNCGPRAGATVVQLYGHDVAASVTRPLRQLLAYARVELAPGETRQVTFRLPAARFALVDRTLSRVVEPGVVELWLGHDADHPAGAAVAVELTGPVAAVTAATPRLAEVAVA
jgi:beta-glucosidase